MASNQKGAKRSTRIWHQLNFKVEEDMWKDLHDCADALSDEHGVVITVAGISRKMLREGLERWADQKK